MATLADLQKNKIKLYQSEGKVYYNEAGLANRIGGGVGQITNTAGMDLSGIQNVDPGDFYAEKLNSKYGITNANTSKQNFNNVNDFYDYVGKSYAPVVDAPTPAYNGPVISQAPPTPFQQQFAAQKAAGESPESILQKNAATQQQQNPANYQMQAMGAQAPAAAPAEQQSSLPAGFSMGPGGTITKNEQPVLPLQPGERQALINKYVSAGYPLDQATKRVNELFAGRPDATAGTTPPPSLTFNPTGEQVSTLAPGASGTSGSSPFPTSPPAPTGQMGSMTGGTTPDDGSSLLTPTADELATQQQIDAIIAKEAAINASMNLGQVDAAGQPIPMQFITGQQSHIQDQAAAQLGALTAQEVPLKDKLARLQQTRQVAMDVSKAKTDAADKLYDRQRQEKLDAAALAKQNAPAGYTEVSPGATLFDPATGKAVYTAPTTKGLNGGSSGSSGSSGGGSAGSPGGPITGKAGGGLEGLSAEARYYYDNPTLFGTATPTKQGQVVKAFADAGVKFDAAALTKVSAGQRDNLAKMDSLISAATLATEQLPGLNTGVLASPYQSAKAKLGIGNTREFTNYASSISNLNSLLVNLRSGQAVTPSEAKRLEGFIPLINDDQKTAAQKLSSFAVEYQKVRNDYITRSTQTTQQIIQSATNTAGADAVSAAKNKYGISY